MIKNTTKSTGCNSAREEKATNVNLVQRDWFPLITDSEPDICGDKRGQIIPKGIQSLAWVSITPQKKELYYDEWSATVCILDSFC